MANRIHPSVYVVIASFRARLRDVESIRRLNSSLFPDDFGVVQIDSNGVDRAQIRRQLRLTPGERMRALESFLASVLKIRRDIPGTSVSRDTHPAC